MNTHLPGNLAEIFPLRFRLRDELRFFRVPGAMVVERVARRQRYSVKVWQFEMLARFDGSQTFERVAQEVYSLQPNGFTAMGLLNFYNWLYDEDLVLCECESVFELIGEDRETDEDSGFALKLLSFGRRWQGDERIGRGVKIAGAIIFSLSVIRLAYITAPIFEPPADRLHVEVKKLFQKTDASVSHGELARAAEMSSVEKVALAAKVEIVPAAAPTREVVPGPTTTEGAFPTEGVPESTKVAVTEAPVPVVGGDIESIETLRTQLEECRIRRDEFYLQNNEEGYRREVHRMTSLAKEIGDIETRL